MSKNISFDPFEDEQKTQEGQSNKVFDAKNYLNVKLAKGENTKEIRIRLLPVDKNSNDPFKFIHMHSTKVPTEISANGFKSYVCLRKTEGAYTEQLGNKCPFCEARKVAYDAFVKAKEEGDLVSAEKFKAESLSLRENEVGIIRCIERGKEEEGPKFWKFNIRSDKQDVFNQIKALAKNYKRECDEEENPNNSLLDLYTGKDLLVTIERIQDKQGAYTNKTTIKIAPFGTPKPISKDEDKIDEWINDPKIWSDVFVAKPYDYLNLIKDGKIPWYDRVNNKWVEKIEYNNSKNSTEIAPEDEIEETTKSSISDDDDNIPF